MHNPPCITAEACALRSPRSALAAGARDRIVGVVARHFALDADTLTAPTRCAPHVARARQVAMYLAHVGYGLDFATVGRLFCRDRTTVSHACRVIEDLRDDPSFDSRIAVLERVCNARAKRPQPGEGR